jgi:hypothetical protein
MKYLIVIYSPVILNDATNPKDTMELWNPVVDCIKDDENKIVIIVHESIETPKIELLPTNGMIEPIELDEIKKELIEKLNNKTAI